MQIPKQTAAWYDRLATLQAGYYYPWSSQLDPDHGEDRYVALVHRYLQPDATVLDVACGHGAQTLDFAPYCRTIVGYDRTAGWIRLAQEQARRAQQPNATFILHDSSPHANGGHARLPVTDASCDLIVCSKGPFHWIDDACRAARSSATLIMLVPDATPLTPWQEALPEVLRWTPAPDRHWARSAIEQRLVANGLTLQCWWEFDVPEYFAHPDDLYDWLTWGEPSETMPTRAAIRPTLEQIFVTHGQSHGVAIRHRRYLWLSTIPE
jgi:23S rRNA (guanine745-N1)-methyltransferase